MKPLGLYIHIPFCRRKCAYCDFVSFPDKEEIFDEYITALIKEAGMYSDYFSEHEVDTLFIGGGTPSLLSAKQINKLMVGINEACNLNIKEATIEANPETLNEEKLATYAESGINRLSIGLQTHDDAILSAIGRRHTYGDFLLAYETARKYFDNINTDIIFGLPGQTVESFRETLERVVSLKPSHISAYSLKLEPGTKLFDTYEGADEETDRKMYHDAVKSLKNAGYEHYETSNFALPGRECLHNLKYWTGEEYLGLGVAAHSYLFLSKKFRYSNTENLSDYLTLIMDNKRPAVSDEKLSKTDEITEYIMLRLRLKQGIIYSEYNEKFNTDFEKHFAEQITTVVKAGLVTSDRIGIYPSLKGFDLQNMLISLFMKNI